MNLDDIQPRPTALTGSMGALLIPACPSCHGWTARARIRTSIGDRICCVCGARCTVAWSGEADAEWWSVRAAAPQADEHGQEQLR